MSVKRATPAPPGRKAAMGRAGIEPATLGLKVLDGELKRIEQD
jgi:hypothetical protein